MISCLLALECSLTKLIIPNNLAKPCVQNVNFNRTASSETEGRLCIIRKNILQAHTGLQNNLLTEIKARGTN